MAAERPGGRSLDPGIKLVLEELRDLRLEMRADRLEARADRRRADEERRRVDADRRQADAERRQAEEERRQADAEWREEQRRADGTLRRERQESNERFQELLREFRQDSARREAATQKAFKAIRTVGLSIVKTLNHHTRILERIDHKLGARGPWRPGRQDGRGA